MTATKQIAGTVQWGSGANSWRVPVKLRETSQGWACDEFDGQPWIWSDERTGETIAEANKPQKTPILAIRQFLRTWDRYGSVYVKPGSISTSATNLEIDA